MRHGYILKEKENKSNERRQNHFNKAVPIFFFIKYIFKN